MSILDGWWVEGDIEGLTGWAIGQAGQVGTPPSERSADAANLYDCIALNGSFFNTQRMIQQYIMKAYFL